MDPSGLSEYRVALYLTPVNSMSRSMETVLPFRPLTQHQYQSDPDRLATAQPLYDEGVIRTLAAIVAGLLLVSCGGEGLSLAEYNTQGLVLAAAMEERLYELDAAWVSATATVEPEAAEDAEMGDS